MNDERYNALREAARGASCSVQELVNSVAAPLPMWCFKEYDGPDALLADYSRTKLTTFARAYGGTVTGRMSSTQPSFAELPKSSASKMMERMRDEIFSTMLKAAQLNPEPHFVMKCTKPRNGTSKTVQIDLETYGSEFFFAGLNSPKDTMNKTSNADYGQATGTASYQTAESLREQLSAAEAREAAEQAAVERDLYLASLSNLASQTERLINAVRFPSNNRLAFGKAHLKALKALADELGAKIQPTNDAGYFTVLVAA